MAPVHFASVFTACVQCSHQPSWVHVLIQIRAPDHNFRRPGSADEGQNQSKAMFGSKWKSFFFFFLTLMSSVEPQLIRQVQILQHDLIIWLWERKFLQMGVCHIPPLINCSLITVHCHYTMTSVLDNCSLCHAVVTEWFYFLWREQVGANFSMHWFIQLLLHIVFGIFSDGRLHIHTWIQTILSRV